ncbi:MAG: zinc-ribbon domain containing protein [Candidatus Kerfeldbacteria bacterium]|nr:zinc-ribbon domain containing protein [Candidatus Kerfeldbacteria bacterium]
MIKQCAQCSKTFQIDSSDQDFYKRMQVPVPKLCPNCRQQRRLAWRNERSLYPGTCQHCRKPLISLYSPNKPYTIYCQDCWLSDQWDPFDYARDYNPKQSFFEQVRELQLVVPRMAITIRNCENRIAWILSCRINVNYATK